MPPPTNPDARPLPSGWYQHYDPSRKTWYYVQTSVHPPKHSFVHPAELLGPGPPANPRRHPVTMPTPPPESQGPKLSAAQRLYASAQQTTGGPMVSIPDDGLDRAVPQAPNTNRASPAAFHYNPSTTSTPSSQQGGQNTHSRPSGARTQSQGTIFATATNPSNYYNSHRSASYPVPHTSHANLNSSAPLGGNQPRHIVTKAQPPSLLLSGGFGAGSTAIPAPSQTLTPAQLIAQGKSLPELPAPVPVNAANAVAYNLPATSPPYSQPYIHAPQEHPKTSPSSPTGPTQPHNVTYPGVADTKQGYGFQVRNPSLPPTAAQHAKRASVSVLKNVGKKIGVATAKFVASGVSTALTGIDVTTLANALTGTSFDFSGLQAVLQAQPNADYSAAIAALQQQQLQQPSPAVDYASLISQIQQLQALAVQQQQQQQQILAMQLTNLNQNNAILAAQQQAALGGGAAAVPPNPAIHGNVPSQHALPPQGQGQTQIPAHSTNPFAYSPTTPNYNQQISPPLVAPVSNQNVPNGHQAHAPPVYNPLPTQQHTGPNPTQSPPPSFSATAQSPPQDNLFQTLQAQQAAANQQMQNQIQQYQLAAQGQQQAMMAQIQQQSQAAQAQQQAALAQAMQQQQIQQQQNQALLNSIAAPPPAQGNSFTDLMTTYLNGALGGGAPQQDPAGSAEIPPSYSGLMSTLGLGGGTESAAPGDLSSLDISVDLSSTFGSLDLSGLTSGALTSFE